MPCLRLPSRTGVKSSGKRKQSRSSSLLVNLGHTCITGSGYQSNGTFTPQLHVLPLPQRKVKDPELLKSRPCRLPAARCLWFQATGDSSSSPAPWVRPFSRGRPHAQRHSSQTPTTTPLKLTGSIQVPPRARAQHPEIRRKHVRTREQQGEDARGPRACPVHAPRVGSRGRCTSSADRGLPRPAAPARAPKQPGRGHCGLMGKESWSWVTGDKFLNFSEPWAPHLIKW